MVDRKDSLDVQAHLAKIMDERDRAYQQRWEAQEKAISYAMTAQEKAVANAFNAQEKAVANAFNAQEKAVSASLEVASNSGRVLGLAAAISFIIGVTSLILSFKK